MPVDSEQSDDVSDVSSIDAEETESDPLPTDSDYESNSELTEQQNELEKKKPHLSVTNKSTVQAPKTTHPQDPHKTPATPKNTRNATPPPLNIAPT